MAYTLPHLALTPVCHQQDIYYFYVFLRFYVFFQN